MADDVRTVGLELDAVHRPNELGGQLDVSNAYPVRRELRQLPGDAVHHEDVAVRLRRHAAALDDRVVHGPDGTRSVQLDSVNHRRPGTPQIEDVEAAEFGTRRQIPRMNQVGHVDAASYRQRVGFVYLDVVERFVDDEDFVG